MVEVGARYVTNIMHKFAVDIIILPSALFSIYFSFCVRRFHHTKFNGQSVKKFYISFSREN